MSHDRSCFALATLLSLLFVLAGSAARAVTVEQIPTPRPAGWAVDMTQTLSLERLAELNRLGEDVKTKAGAEMAVVVVPSTDGVDAHEFATRLFHAWRIGDQTSQNGILVFAALNDHRAEIVLGNGLDTEAARQESQTVMQQVMIPRFRNGDPTGAVVLGALACARRLLGVSPLVEGVETPPGMAVTPAPAEGTSSYTDSGGIVHPIAPPTPYPSQVPVSYDDRVAASQAVEGVAWLVGVIATFGGIAGYVITRKPHCPKCKQKMVMLDEQADDAYLQPSEKVEERIGSIDYQIWSCPTCGELKKRRSSSFFSRYSTCPECGAKTLSSESTTLRQATYSYGGEIQVDQTCANCSYRNSYIRYTAQLVRQEERSYSSSSSSSSGSLLGLLGSSSVSSSSSFTSSSGSSSSGSSSSSGFSGGDSSGGGASGSW